MMVRDWSDPDGVFATDACLQGCGGVCDGLYFHATFPDWILSLELHINALEMLTILVAIKLWGHGWKGLRIRVSLFAGTGLPFSHLGVRAQGSPHTGRIVQVQFNVVSQSLLGLVLFLIMFNVFQ